MQAKRFSVLSILATLLLLSACSPLAEETDWDIEGIIAQTSPYLVVSGVDREDIEGLSEQELLEKADDAIYFGFEEDLDLYERVRVTFTGINDSYPASGEVDELERVEER
ncbi:hypothetical protein JOC54_003183 [Alkalihalobacillus xiaoxiensis]|uniref:DUF3221 domain-containing protein n=1 Tax=Shouchella xiaoxiensis TaxID=766895 RepID=A0ABS2SWI9_9BACI|nr:DUF3221 domain-containing protein [Shouchella xiaoxiensis]MBM7839903.1 hypothetical protein [Shouchella xiaoxiensis]